MQATVGSPCPRALACHRLAVMAPLPRKLDVLGPTCEAGGQASKGPAVFLLSVQVEGNFP